MGWKAVSWKSTTYSDNSNKIWTQYLHRQDKSATKSLVFTIGNSIIKSIGGEGKKYLLYWGNREHEGLVSIRRTNETGYKLYRSSKKDCLSLRTKQLYENFNLYTDSKLRSVEYFIFGNCLVIKMPNEIVKIPYAGELSSMLNEENDTKIREPKHTKVGLVPPKMFELMQKIYENGGTMEGFKSEGRVHLTIHHLKAQGYLTTNSPFKLTPKAHRALENE